MAARVLLRRRVAAPFMAATLAGGALYPSIALAEAPSPPSPSLSPDHPSKKPIYDDYEAPLPDAGTPTPSPTSDTIPTSKRKPRRPTPTDRLALQIGKARMFLYRYAAATEDAVNSTVDSAFALERSFTSTIASLAPARETGEKLMPGLVYVLVASMAGSIVARNRGVLLRASVPLALGVGAAWLFVPVTMTNVSALLWTYEQRFPAVAGAHLQTRDGIQRGWHFTKVHVEASRNYVEEKVHDTRDIVKSWVKKGK
ncbi:apolipo protein O-domain-containing protein [Xylariaceae sp. FL0662B]|nr:apolipo protein O-domain-containing protein [Xylariaceae sp. FL0662B]